MDPLSKQRAASLVAESGEAGRARITVMSGKFCKNCKHRLSEDDPCRSGQRVRQSHLDLWAYARGVTLDFSELGKPAANAFIEAFNGRFRSECRSQKLSLVISFLSAFARGQLSEVNGDQLACRFTGKADRRTDNLLFKHRMARITACHWL